MRKENTVRYVANAIISVHTPFPIKGDKKKWEGNEKHRTRLR
jgi:hypothetical protein